MVELLEKLNVVELATSGFNLQLSMVQEGGTWERVYFSGRCAHTGAVMVT